MRKLLLCLLFLLLPTAFAGAETLYASDFSAGADGWYGRGAQVRVTDDGLYTDSRTAAWQSPGRAFDLIAGETYRISVEVWQDVLDSGRFILSAEHAKDGAVSYENLAFATVARGEWTALTATWTAGDFDTFVLYVEGGEADTPFTIRNFTLSGEGTAAPTEPVKEEENVPFAMPETAEELTALFDALPLARSHKQAGENNPLFTQRFGADPGYLVWNDRLYVYTTNDVIEYAADGSVKENGYGLVNQINCISSADLVNWTDHGAIPVAGPKGIAAWARNSWAPCAAHKTIDGQEKFFLYFCNGGNGVSVLTADDPAGPWTDPLGHGLITRSVPHCADVVWLFDPAVFVDEDGTGYLYFGGGMPEGKAADPGTIRCVRLGDDMISLDSEVMTIHAPYVFEDSGINRIGDTYYYSYCSNWQTDGNDLGMTSGAIQYMTSDSPMGPFTYRGEVFPNQGRFFGMWGNNHHSIAQFKGVYYLLYHNRPVEKSLGITGNYRSPQLDVLHVSEDGTLTPVRGTMAGVPQLCPLSPYEAVSARTMARQAGLTVTDYADKAVLEATSGDWLEVRGVLFDRGASAFTMNAGSETGGAVRVLAGDMVLCELVIPAGTVAADLTVPCGDAEGETTLTLVFAGQVTANHWRFHSR